MLERSRVRGAAKARIEMVPLIDCMFLLLTFFIYAATTMTIQRGIPVELASASTAISSGDAPWITVSVDALGRIYLEKHQVSELELKDELHAEALRPKPKPVLLKADKKALHEQVVGILDLARQSGIPQVIMAVRPISEEKGHNTFIVSPEGGTG